jgi:uncharacterized protein (DUF924 family)
MTTPQEIIHFWFQELDAQKRFAKSEEIDQKIRDRFLQTYDDVINDKTSSWRTTPEGRLAEIIVLDQFARNMFRDSAKAFAADGLALELAEATVATGDDQKLTPEQKAFVYMPYMHSESRSVHEIAVKLFSQPGLEYNLKYEIMHKKIIDRFGRYPHRNAVLGRVSTQDEIAFLKEPGSSF